MFDRLRRWLIWRPWRPAYFELKPWESLRFTRLVMDEQQRCLGAGYASCSRYPHPPSLMRRLTAATASRSTPRR